MNEIIGIDYGEKYVGIARINSLVAISEPLKTCSGSYAELLKVIESYIQEFGTSEIVVGLPRGLDGQQTSQTELCIDFARKLSSDLKTVPVYMIDEAGTSKEAISRKSTGSKAGIDSIAAGIMLEDFIALSFEQKSLLNIKNIQKG